MISYDCRDCLEIGSRGMRLVVKTWEHDLWLAATVGASISQKSMFDKIPCKLLYMSMTKTTTNPDCNIDNH
jgi:hypothetical protein